MRKFIPLIFIAFTYIFLFSLIKNNSLYDDEPSHFTQIRLFLNRHPAIYSRLSLIPGYHFTVASLATLTGKSQIHELRAITLTINLLAIALFFLVVQKLDSKNAITKTLQFSFFPILFPFQFLLYAEGLMLLLTLISFYFAHTKKYTLSALFGLLSVLVRQQNIVWLLFINLICLIDDLKQKNVLANLYPSYFRWVYADSNLSLRSILRKYWLFITSYFLFITFVVVNRGIAYGTSDVHPNFTLHSGNVFFALFVNFLLFLPSMISNVNRVIKLIMHNKRVLVLIAIFIVTAALTFSNSHPWNRYPEHLQNRLILVPFTSNLPLKVIFFTIISYSVISLRVTRFISMHYYLLYPFAFLSLAPIWLVGARYSLVPFMLFLLFRKSTSPLVEWAIIILFITISLFLFYGYLNQIFYL